MDRGAARSRKRASQPQTKGTEAQAQTQAQAGPSRSHPGGQRPPDPQDGGDGARTAQAGSSKSTFNGKKDEQRGSDRDGKADKKQRRDPKTNRIAERADQSHAQSEPSKPSKPSVVDPNQYKPKAIRISAALIFSQTPFANPPSPETLASVRRVDLSGSDATDVSWLKGTGVTWLSLAGCKIESGWEAVGSLSELSVLNISGCGLSSLPPALGGLTNLKAIVAMNNEWTTIDSDVVGQWKDLNSLIVSHSPNLSSLPASLSSLNQLSKLTFSHCPRLTAASLPDLSTLPLLRDVKMNNLPLLTTLPKHIVSWGKGDLSLVGKGKDDHTTMRLGDGLQVLDLGNCSLDFGAIAGIFGLNPSGSSAASTSKTGSKKKSSGLGHLRSLSLHSNPLTVTHPNYVELLQNSDDLPNLQIIDAKRVVERKRKGEISEKKVKEKKVNPKSSGANVDSGVKMRTWGSKADGEDNDEVKGDAKDSTGAAVIISAESGSDDDGEDRIKTEKVKEKKTKRKDREGEEAIKLKSKKRRHDDIPLSSSRGEPEKTSKRNKLSSSAPAVAAIASSKVNAAERSKVNTYDKAPSSAQVAVPGTGASGSGSGSGIDHSTQRDKSKSTKQATGLVGVIEIKNGQESELTSKQKKKIKSKIKKGTEVSGGVDLKRLFGKADIGSKAVPTTEVKSAVASGTEQGGWGGDVTMEGGDEDSGLGLGVGGW